MKRTRIYNQYSEQRAVEWLSQDDIITFSKVFYNFRYGDQIFLAYHIIFFVFLYESSRYRTKMSILSLVCLYTQDFNKVAICVMSIWGRQGMESIFILLKFNMMIKCAFSNIKMSLLFLSTARISRGGSFHPFSLCIYCIRVRKT